MRPINGSAIESLFDYEVMSRGYVVSAPRTDSAQYDRVVDSHATMYRVQIKARRGKGGSTIVIQISRSKNQKYTENDADIIALYIENNNSWYLIPINNCKYVFRLNFKKDKLDLYKNNWSVFK